MADMTYGSLTNHQATSGLGQLLDKLSTWRERARQRSQLAQLSDIELRDIALSRADVEFELSKPFWRG